jgi:hypothetical protein
MRNLLPLGVVSVAACVPTVPEYVSCDPEIDEDCYSDDTPTSSPFMDQLSGVLSSRSSGFESLRAGAGARISDGVQTWVQATAVLAPFKENNCAVTRYDDTLAKTSSYVFACGAIDTAARISEAETEMYDQIGRSLPSGDRMSLAISVWSRNISD